MAPVIARRWIRPSISRATPSSTRGHHTTAACPPSWAALSLPVSLSAVQRVHWVLSPAATSTRQPIAGVWNIRKPSYHWQTCATRKHAKTCSNSTCLQRCHRQYWSIFICLAVVASEICKIQEILWKFKLIIEFKAIQGHRSWCQSKAHVRLPISH